MGADIRELYLCMELIMCRQVANIVRSGDFFMLLRDAHFSTDFSAKRMPTVVSKSDSFFKVPQLASFYPAERSISHLLILDSKSSVCRVVETTCVQWRL